jgi:hypothetical protein
MKRNLIYYVCPIAGSRREWENNISVLLQYIHVFNGRKIITIATGHGMSDPKEVSSYFDGCECEIIETPNDPDYCEVIPFMKAMWKLKSPWYQGDGVWSDQISSIRIWRNLMYYYNLNDIDKVEDVLQNGYAAYGAFKATEGFITPWYYAGTFWWFKHDRVFSTYEWEKIRMMRHGIEMYLAEFLPKESAFCDFSDCDDGTGWHKFSDDQWQNLLDRYTIGITMDDVIQMGEQKLDKGEMVQPQMTDYKNVEATMGVALDNQAYVDIFRHALNKVPNEISSVVDLGAGVGALCVAAAEKEYTKIVAYDILEDRDVPEGIDYRFEDFTVAVIPDVDMYAAIEVFEHIDDEILNRFMNNCPAKYFLFSSTPHTSPTDYEWGHINIKQTDEWIDLFDAWGYTVHSCLTYPTPWSLLFIKK